MYLAVFGVDLLPNTVDLLVHFGSMVVALLTSSGNGEGNSAGMPCTDAGNLPQTLVRLTRQFFRVPTRSNACK